ncbi:MAG: hypothetical protein ACLUYZ_01415 [Lachnospiraceae bacterium]
MASRNSTNRPIKITTSYNDRDQNQLTITSLLGTKTDDHYVDDQPVPSPTPSARLVYQESERTAPGTEGEVESSSATTATPCRPTATSAAGDGTPSSTK